MAKYDKYLSKLVSAFGLSRIGSLETRIAQAETNIAIITAGGTPVQGSYIFGDWSHDGIIQFAAWTA